MALPRLLHIPRHTLRIVVYIVACALGAGVLLFFGLTRTELGRDGLRRQIEQQFAETFEGRMEVGQMTGNLIQQLFARDVRLYDPQGRLVLHVDSLVATPNWQDVLRKRFSVGSLTLMRPTFHVIYQADSTWNVADVFERRAPKPTTLTQPWAFDSADLYLIDGVLQTHYEEGVPPAVEAGWLFNFADTEVRDMHARATLEWGSDIKLIDIFSFSAALPDVPFTINTFQGQFLLEANHLLVNQVVLEAGGTELRLDSVIDQLDALRTDSLEALLIEAELRPSRIDFSELHALAPGLPVSDAVTIAARIQGPLARLTLDSFSVERGRTRVQADGTLYGFPDSLGVNLTLQNTTLDANDLQALLPTSRLADLAYLGPLSIKGVLDGVAGGGLASPQLTLRTNATLDIRGRSGHIGGSLAFRRHPGTAPRFTLDLTADALDIGGLVNDARLQSALNGQVRIEGHHLSFDSLSAAVQINLHPSVFAGRHTDSIHVDASIAERRLEATAFAREDRQGVFANVVLNGNTSQPSYRLGLITRRLDLGPLLGTASLQTSLNTRWTLEGAGSTWEEVQGVLHVAFDSSRVAWEGSDRLLLPHHTAVTVYDPFRDGPRVEVTGDAFSLRLDDMPSFDATQTLTALWTYVGGEEMDGHAERTYTHRPAPPPSSLPPAAPSLDQIQLREEARLALATAGLDRMTLAMALEIRRADLLAALLPMLPPVSTDLSLAVRLTADVDSLRLHATATGDSLHLAPLSLDAFQADLRASVSLDAGIEQSLQTTLEVRADSLHLGRQTFETPTLSTYLREQTGRLSFTGDRNQGAEPASLAASITLLPDRYRFTLEELTLVLGNYVWHQTGRPPIDLFTNAVVVPNLAFESRTTDSALSQRIRLRGALSNATADTFFVDVEDIGLRQLSDFLSLKRSIGGWLNGQVALTGTTQRELTGALTVEALALDDRLLGHLEASSRYLPGTPDIALDITLSPLAPDSPLPTEAAALRVTENHLRLDGTFRLPQGEEDPGAFDLKLDAKRADAFFFEYIIGEVDKVHGAFAGTGALQGTFSHPLFYADLILTDGRFEVPEFNLHYQIEGPVQVDEEAIKLGDVLLKDPTGGTARITGDILFNEYRFFSFNLTGELDEIQIINVPTFSRDLPFYGTIWASGDATLIGPLYSASLRSANVITSDRSELFIPITDVETVVDPGFIIFADSTGAVPDLPRQFRRENILDRRPVGERTLIEGMEMDLNILAPPGSIVHMVIDPLLGDVINAVGTGRVQLQRREGDFLTFGTFQVDAGDYLFTAGEVFVRRFLVNDGTITWAGDPLNPNLDINAAYRTRASRAGLPEDVSQRLQSTIPLIVHLNINGQLNAVLVDLNLAIDRSRQEAISNTPLLEAYLNQQDRAAEYATSVLLTNSFLLTTESTSNDVLAGSAFNSVSALVSSQLNRYLSQVIPNADFTFGVQSDETADDLDVSAGVAIRLLDERLVIRGQGLYTGLGNNVEDTAQQGLQGEFIVEVRLSPSVSVEVFYRREGDVLSESLLTSETGAGLSYEAQFSSWRNLFQRIFGTKKRNAIPDTTGTPVVEARDG